MFGMDANLFLKMNPVASSCRISVDARTEGKFTAVLTSFCYGVKVNVVELEGFDQCGKEAWLNFIPKRTNRLSFCHSTKGEVWFTWEDPDLKVEIKTSSKYRHVTSTHYFPADFMVNALTKLVDLIE